MSTATITDIEAAAIRYVEATTAYRQLVGESCKPDRQRVDALAAAFVECRQREQELFRVVNGRAKGEHEDKRK